MPKSSKELIDKLRVATDALENNLRDDRLSADTQVDDTSTWCWAIVDLAVRIQRTVGDELHGLDD